MKRTFMDKLEERMHDLEIARRVYFELGGDDEEPARTLHRRERAVTLQAHAEKPMLIVSRARPPAESEEEKRQRKRETDKLAYERKKAGKPKRVGHHGASRAITLKLFLDGGNKPMTSSDLMARWPGGPLVAKNDKQKAYQAVHELKKLGLARYNEVDGYYALSEMGLRLARSSNGAGVQPGA